ncbi:MAG: endo alpha-1,4 polygalactosaminidase [Polyangiales bacterium]
MQSKLHWLFGTTVLCACASDASDAAQLPEEATPLAAETCGEVDRSAIWKPEKGATWDLQLIGPVNTSTNVDVVDIDAETSSKELIASLHRAGKKVICYVNAGAWEPYRRDSKKFPAEVLGKAWSATKYADEKWLDIRRIDVLGPLMEARFDMAKEKGCDAIDADNVDGFDDAGSGADRTGFNLTHDDQLRFNRYIACAAHERGLAIGLKNNPSQADDLVADFDFVVSEQCFDYNECKRYQPFLTADKPVFLVEYQEDLSPNAEAKFSTMCTQADQLGISAILKNDELDAWRVACPSGGAAVPTERTTPRAR